MKIKGSVHQRASLLRDSIFAGSDGLVTTFAIVAGSKGASLSATVVVILGISNLLADGFSMAAGNYLGVKSETAYEKSKGKKENHASSPTRHGMFTFVSFSLAGFLPLFPYIFNIEPKFNLSVLLVAASLFFIGAIRSKVTKDFWVKGGIEMLLVGGFAALVAFFAGFALDKYLNLNI